MKYKALFCDFDQTLIIHEGNGKKLPLPSEKVINAIHKANKHIAIGIATSRSYVEMGHIFDYLEISAPCITTGGAQIVQPQSRKILYERMLRKSQVLEAGKLALSVGVKLLFDDDAEVREFHSSLTFGKPLCLFTKSINNEIAIKLVNALKPMNEVSVTLIPTYIPNESYVTINHPEATKQHGIFEVAKLLGIATEEIIGVGDGYNDFPLLMACGLKIAMGNAVSELKAIAGYIAPTVEEDGVAHVIEKFVLEPSTKA